MTLAVRNLEKIFSPTAGVRGVSFEAADGELLVLLGPSGCGKTTTLRLIAGLEKPDRGQVVIGEEPVTGLPANRRDVAFVFQRPTFLPHRTVAQNIAYPLLCRELGWFDLLWGRFPAAHRKIAVEWAERLSVGPLVDRFPATLSGGEAQRVALARALVKEAGVLLLDEPLANVDVQLRDALRREFLKLKELARERGEGTILYVTHDQEDALLLGDRVALMRNGGIVQLDIPTRLYRDPIDLFAARFLGTPAMNLVAGKLDTSRPGKVVIHSLGAALEVDESAVRRPELIADGRPVTLGFRPDLPEFGGTDEFQGRVSAVYDVGRECRVSVDVGGEEITVLFAEARRFSHGENVPLRLDAEQIFAFDPETEQRII